MVSSSTSFSSAPMPSMPFHQSTNRPPRIVRSKTPNAYTSAKRPRAESLKRSRTPMMMDISSPEGDATGPWAQTVNTYTWVLEQQYEFAEFQDSAYQHQRQRQRVGSLGGSASVETRVFEPEWTGSSRHALDVETQRAWEEKAYSVDVQARLWMLQEEARRIAAQREAERTRLVQEEVRRIQARIQMRREAERQRIIEERRHAYQDARDRESRRRDIAATAAATAWRSYESGWESIASSSDRLTFQSIPWPMTSPPPSPSSITLESIAAFLFSPSHSTSLTRKDRIKEALRRWHPDRFGRFLNRVIDEERNIVEEGVGLVARHLNELLSRQSQQQPRPSRSL